VPPRNRIYFCDGTERMLLEVTDFMIEGDYWIWITSGSSAQEWNGHLFSRLESERQYEKRNPDHCRPDFTLTQEGAH